MRSLLVLHVLLSSMLLSFFLACGLLHFFKLCVFAVCFQDASACWHINYQRELGEPVYGFGNQHFEEILIVSASEEKTEAVRAVDLRRLRVSARGVRPSYH